MASALFFQVCVTEYLALVLPSHLRDTVVCICVEVEDRKYTLCVHTLLGLKLCRGFQHAECGGVLTAAALLK